MGEKATPLRVLIVDDDESMSDLVRAELRGHGISSAWQPDCDAALERLRVEHFDAVLADVRMRRFGGIRLREILAEEDPDIPVLLMTGHADLDSAVAALRAGAVDLLTKPPDMDMLIRSLLGAVHRARASERVRRLGEQPPEVLHGMIGSSSSIRQVADLARRVARLDASVVIRGESGTGKELVARALHDLGPRCRRAFVALNCAAVPRALLEAELFGHVRGAFTDARSSRSGLFERARGGTIFLDEIAELDVMLQPKLLRALQEKTIRPIGSDREVEVDVRVVAATNVDLTTAVAEGRFRADLLYRLAVIEVAVPPLRERGDDVLLLAQHFLEQAASTMKRSVVGITPACASRLVHYTWPGNVRELANVIGRAVALTRTKRLTVEDLPPRVRCSEVIAGEALTHPGEGFIPLWELERRYARHVLKAARGDRKLAAKILGIVPGGVGQEEDFPGSRS